MYIAAKEARETEYWLRLLADSSYIDINRTGTQQLFDDSNSLIKLLTSIVKSSKAASDV